MRDAGSGKWKASDPGLPSLPASPFSFLAVIGALLIAGHAAAQTRSVRVTGLAFDSLRSAPLRDAHVAILGLPGNATTDERGRFTFDHVPIGSHTFVVQHPVLDSVGFSGLSRLLDIREDVGEIVLGIPSFATVWRTACGRPPPRDSGLVFGTIRTFWDGKPVADAFVDLTWMHTSYEKAHGLRQRAHRGATRSDSTGGYVVCGVPISTWLRVDAGVSTGASGRIDMPPAVMRIQRRDLLLGPSGGDSATRGTVIGHVTDPDGGPLFNARVVLDDSTEVRSGPDGRFVLSHVNPGTRQVEVLAIGAVPVVSAIDVMPNETSTLAVQLRRVTTLDVVQVTASRRGRRVAAEIAERKRSGFSHTMEIGELVAHSSMGTVFADFPGIIVQRRGTDFTVFVNDGRGGQCSPDVWIDGARSMYATLNSLRPREVAAVEVFPRSSNVPMQYRPVEVKSWCGVILVWTNWVFGR